MQFRTQLMFLSVIRSVLTVCVVVAFHTAVSRDELVDSESQSKALLLFSMTNTGSGGSRAEEWGGVGCFWNGCCSHLGSHCEEGLPFWWRLTWYLLQDHGNSLICSPRVFPLQQWDQQRRVSGQFGQLLSPRPGHLTAKSYTLWWWWNTVRARLRPHDHIERETLSTGLWQWGGRERESLHDVGDRSQTLMSMVVHSGAHLLLMMTVDHTDLAQCMADEYSWLRLTVLICLI